MDKYLIEKYWGPDTKDFWYGTYQNLRALIPELDDAVFTLPATDPREAGLFFLRCLDSEMPSDLTVFSRKTIQLIRGFSFIFVIQAASANLNSIQRKKYDELTLIDDFFKMTFSRFFKDEKFVNFQQFFGSRTEKKSEQIVLFCKLFRALVFSILDFEVVKTYLKNFAAITGDLRFSQIDNLSSIEAISLISPTELKDFIKLIIENEVILGFPSIDSSPDVSLSHKPIVFANFSTNDVRKTIFSYLLNLINTEDVHVFVCFDKDKLFNTLDYNVKKIQPQSIKLLKYMGENRLTKFQILELTKANADLMESAFNGAFKRLKDGFAEEFGIPEIYLINEKGLYYIDPRYRFFVIDE